MPGKFTTRGLLAVGILAAGFFVGAVFQRAREVRRLEADLSPEEVSRRARERARRRRERGLPGIELSKPPEVLATATPARRQRADSSRAAPPRNSSAAPEASEAEEASETPARWRSADWSEGGGNASSAFLERTAADAQTPSVPGVPAPSEYENPRLSGAAAGHLEIMRKAAGSDPKFSPARYVESIPDYTERAGVIAALDHASPAALGSYGRLSRFSSARSGSGLLQRAGSVGSTLSLGSSGSAGGGSPAGGGSSAGGVSGAGASPSGSSGDSAGGGSGSGGTDASGPGPGKPRERGRPKVQGRPRVELKLDPKKMKPAGPPYAHDKGKPKTVQVYSMLPGANRGPLYFTADMDIDADGAGGHYKRDKTGQSETSLRYKDGGSLNPGTLPFFVLPSDFPKSHPGVRLGDIALVQYGGKQTFAIYGDNGPRGMIGEGSIALAESLGINPDPNRGGTSGGVTYIVFPGSKLKTTPRSAGEIEAAAQPFLKALAPELRKGDLLAEPASGAQ
jgi:hypothetical protein